MIYSTLEEFVLDLLDAHQTQGLTLYEALQIAKKSSWPSILIDFNNGYGPDGPTSKAILAIFKEQNWIDTRKTRGTYYVWKPQRLG